MFKYTTINSLREAGLKSRVTDSEAERRIKRYSSLIDMLTGQYFLPKVDTEIVKGSYIVSLEEYVPIIQLNTLTRILYDDSRESLTEQDYNLYERYIEIINKKYFNAELEILKSLGYKEKLFRYEIDGVFGWIEQYKESMSFSLTQDIIAGSTQIELNSVEGLKKRDILTISNENFIVDSVDSDTNIVTIDASEVNINKESEVKCYGQIPYMIEQAVILLCLNSKKLDKIIGGRVKYESVDDYKYSVSTTLSGIQEVDLVIENYSRPVFVSSSYL